MLERVAELVFHNIAQGRILIAYGKDKMAQTQNISCSSGIFAVNSYVLIFLFIPVLYIRSILFTNNTI